MTEIAAGAVLGRRALNRALLQRQMLLEPRELAVGSALEQLVGIQAQEPQAPYIGLWSRLADFAPEELSELISTRRAVRGSLMRCTVHLVSARDWLRLWPAMQPVLQRNLRGSVYGKQLDGVPIRELIARGRELLAERPRTRTELAPLLAESWPQADPASLAHAASLLTPTVQVPPRGLWRRGGQARWADAASWLGAEVNGRAVLPEIVGRYLRAFGPATVQDVQAWCGLTRLSEVVAAMKLHRLRDEQGRELLDVPGVPLPDPETPAPVRFLAPFDNVLLSHADRSRIMDSGTRAWLNRDRIMRAFLVDGYVAGTWSSDGTALHVRPMRRLAREDRDAVVREAERLVAFLFAAPQAAEIVVHPEEL